MKDRKDQRSVEQKQKCEVLEEEDIDVKYLRIRIGI